MLDVYFLHTLMAAASFSSTLTKMKQLMGPLPLSSQGLSQFETQLTWLSCDLGYFVDSRKFRVLKIPGVFLMFSMWWYLLRFLWEHVRSLSGVQLFATLWNVACQVPLSMGFSRQEYWQGWPFPSPGDLPNPGIKQLSLMFPALADRFFTTSTSWEA